MVELGQRPAAVTGERPERVATVPQQLPQALGGVDAAGEAATHPHDGDRLAGAGLEFLQPRPGPSQIDGHLFKEMTEPVLVAHPVISTPDFYDAPS
jgi:hypothetical protein